MISAILQILGSGAFGSLIGGITTYFTRKEECAMLAEKNRHDESMLGLQNQQALGLTDAQVDDLFREADALV